MRPYVKDQLVLYLDVVTVGSLKRCLTLVGFALFAVGCGSTLPLFEPPPASLDRFLPR